MEVGMVCGGGKVIGVDGDSDTEIVLVDRY